MSKLRYRVGLIRARVRRREDRGYTVPADVMWGWIRSSWPSLPEEAHEAIFQGAA